MRNIRIPQVFTLILEYQQVTEKIKQKRQLIFINCRFQSKALTNYRTNL